MADLLSPKEFLELNSNWPVIDVRSPGEFDAGHIPFAINIPLFTNEERAIIGTLYVQQGKEQAVKQGLEMVGKKFSYFIAEVEKLAQDRCLRIHCWRGGMRSESLAWFFEKLGYKVYILQGGYKAYRKYIRASFSENSRLRVIGGMTGCGKTEILQHLHEMGEQVIDLEALANHKGSAFGHLGQAEQPTTEQFENNLYLAWSQLDHSRSIWLEHESIRIGKIFLPDTFFAALQKGFLLQVDLPSIIRVERLMKEYAHFETGLLKEAILHIKMEMGTQQCKWALEALEERDFRKLTEILLAYYDKTYRHSMEKRPVKPSAEILLDSADMALNTNKILNYLNAQDGNSK